MRIIKTLFFLLMLMMFLESMDWYRSLTFYINTGFVELQSHELYGKYIFRHIRCNGMTLIWSFIVGLYICVKLHNFILSIVGIFTSFMKSVKCCFKRKKKKFQYKSAQTIPSYVVKDEWE